MVKYIAVALLAFIACSTAYVCSTCLGDMCCNIPANHEYYLTSFCAGYPHDQTSCGNYCDQYQYFTADRQRFGCGGYLHLCGNGKCVNAKVIDAGPANWVEQDAGMPIIDASTACCSYLFGYSSCGWSDRRLITATPTSAITDDHLGPFEVTPEQYESLMKGVIPADLKFNTVHFLE